MPASPGAATGKVVFSADEAEEFGNKGEIIILVREETKPDDIHGFISAQGVLTSRGGKTSHAAVVARSMGKPCVSGCNAIKINDRKKIFQVNDRIIKERNKVYELGVQNFYTKMTFNSHIEILIELEAENGDAKTLIESDKGANMLKNNFMKINTEEREDTTLGNTTKWFSENWVVFARSYLRCFC